MAVKSERVYSYVETGSGRTKLQENTYSGSTDIVGYYSGTGIHYTCGQGFQVTGAVPVDRVIISLATVGSPTNNFTVRIETDSSGLPSGTLVHANATVSVATSTLTTGDNTFTFAKSFGLAASTQYHIVMVLDAQSHDTSHYVQVDYSYGTDRYAYGTFERKADAGAWSASGYATYDLKFSVWSADLGSTSVTISSLDGDTDEEYELRTRIVHGVNCNGLIRLNNDTGSTYGYQQLRGIGTGASADRDTATAITIAAADDINQVSQASTFLYAKSGYVRTAVIQSDWGVATTSVLITGAHGWSWNNTGSNVTSIVVLASATYGLGVGSTIELYRKVTV